MKVLFPGFKRLFLSLLLLFLYVFHSSSSLLWPHLFARRALRLLGGSRAAAAAARQPAPPPPAPYRAFMSNIKLDSGTERGELYHPHFEYVLFPPEGRYPVSVVADAFIVCTGPDAPSLKVMSRHYQRTPELDHTALQVEAAGVPLGPGAWFFNRGYETLAVGTFALPAALAAPLCALPPRAAASQALLTRFTYANTTALHNVTRSPEPPPSQFAMVAVFSFSRFLLRLWLEYYYALGVDTFYLFYNGDSSNPTNVTQVALEVAGFRGSIVVMDWSVLHWIQTDGRDITCGQPIAINTALQRWRHLHAFMMFYDTDELLVLPRHASLGSYVAQYAAEVEPIVALRSMCSWGQFNLSTPQAAAANISTIADVTLPHLAWLSVERGRPGGREKYLLNTSAVDAWGIRYINLHGVYSHQGGEGGGREGHPSIMPVDGHFAGYHLHILNVPDDSRKMDSREIFLSKTPIINDELAQAVRKGLVERVRSKGAGRKGRGGGGGGED